MTTAPSRQPIQPVFLVIPWGIGVATAVIQRYRGTWPRYVDWHRWMDEHGISSTWRHYDNLLIYIAAALIGALLISRVVDVGVRDLLCWRFAGRRWAWMVAWACLPMVGAGAVTALTSSAAPPDPSWWPDIHSGVIRAPIGEELLFRGLLVGTVSGVLGWGGPRWWLNAYLAATLFGAMHVPWTRDAVAAWPNFTVTLIGGLWYAWLLAQWRSLWVPIGLHAGMNFGWMLLGAGGGAGGGGLWPNLLRAATITIATVWTVRMGRAERAAMDTMSSQG